MDPALPAIAAGVVASFGMGVVVGCLFAENVYLSLEKKRGTFLGLGPMPFGVSAEPPSAPHQLTRYQCRCPQCLKVHGVLLCHPADVERGAGARIVRFDCCGYEGTVRETLVGLGPE